MFYLPTWAIVILALAAGAGMGFCAVKKEDPKFRPLAVVCVIILMACAYCYIDNEIGIGRPNKEQAEMTANSERLNEAKVKAVCEYIKAQNPGKIVVVAQGGKAFDKNENAKKQFELIKKYLGACEIKALDYELKEDNPEPVEIKAEDWNKFFNANADAKLFLILEQLPMDEKEIAKISLGKQKIAFLDMSADFNLMRPFFENGTIVVATTAKPGLKQEDYEKAVPEDLKEAFDSRYILVDKKNIKDVK